MSLEEYIDVIIEAAEELRNESIDYDKMNVLYNLLKKLVGKYANKSAQATLEELESARWKLSTEMAIIKSDKTREVLDNLYTITVNRISGNSLPGSERTSETIDEQIPTAPGKMVMI